MGYNKSSPGTTDTGMWLEYVLILILVVIVVAAVVPLVRPFIDNQISKLCASTTTELFLCKP